MNLNQAVTDKLQELVKPYDCPDKPGVVFGLNHKGKSILRGAYGLSSIEHNVANTLKTRMRIGSTGKQFTCLAILLLSEQGKLALTDTVDKFFPDFPAFDNIPNLAHLMSHTSGIRDVQDEAFQAAGITPQPAGKIIPAIMRQKDLAFQPGEGQLYCNAGYYLLSEIIAKVSGESFPDYMVKHIFTPLGMTDTEFVLSDMNIVANMATSYLPTSEHTFRRGLMPNEESSGCGGAISTVDDMLLWASHLREENALVSKDAWQQMKASTQLNNGLKSDYGFGLWNINYRGVDVLQHAGGVIGGNTQLLCLPAEELDIVVITNTDGISSSLIANQCLEVLLAEKLSPPTAPASSEGLSHLFGEFYKNDRGVIYSFDDVNGMMGLSIHLSPCAPVLKKEGEQYTTSFNDLAMGPFSFSPEDVAADANESAPAQITMLECGYADTFVKQEKVDHLAPEQLQNYSGEYYCDDMDTYAQVFVAGDTLKMRFLGQYGVREHQLTPVLKDIFKALATDPIAPTLHPIIFDCQAEEVTGFTTNSVRARDRYFKRLNSRQCA